MTDALRKRIRDYTFLPEARLVSEILQLEGLNPASRQAVSARAAGLVDKLRSDTRLSFLDTFLGEYDLSSAEGVALMCLAEAFLRVPDADTLDELISEKIAGSNWQSHLGSANSSLVNASSWALMFTGRLLSPVERNNLASLLKSLLQRLGEPVVRVAMTEMMERMGEHFVLGETIKQALSNARPLEKNGYCFSYDMLGEAAVTEQEAQDYFLAYKTAIEAIAAHANKYSGTKSDPIHRPGISVKLSALHPRFELIQKPQIFELLLRRCIELASLAADNNLCFTIDAEEARRQDISLDIIQSLAESSLLSHWSGLGFVVQAYSRRALPIIDYLYQLAVKRKAGLQLRLVKGAYWDTEIKFAQQQGHDGFPVFTRKVNTDAAYIAAAAKLFKLGAPLYPQFATHNAHTLSAVMELAKLTAATAHKGQFEFQRLFGMGESLHEYFKEKHHTQHRIYAPVGEHQDLLAYLVRRLLENGANNSFVHQLTDLSVDASIMAADPFLQLEQKAEVDNTALLQPNELYLPRIACPGVDLSNPDELERIDLAREPWRYYQWQATPILARSIDPGTTFSTYNPAKKTELIGSVQDTTRAQASNAVADAAAFCADWGATALQERRRIIFKSADLLVENKAEFLSLLTREAGKTVPDAITEWREAVDFLRYYAHQATFTHGRARGVFVCISPWNFPLSIFTGQIAAALVTGNVVLAKPAEQTPLVAARLVQLMLQAGIPRAALQLLTGDGPQVGAVLAADNRVNGICFTGSLETARIINQSMAEKLPVDSVLIAETGGVNAMIVDSTALLQQSVKDILSSAFACAGQRCSALRIVYLQSDIADEMLDLLIDAMATLSMGDPWLWQTDIGPVIDATAKSDLDSYLQSQQPRSPLTAPTQGSFVAPSLIEVKGIADLPGEVFGPVLHVARFEASQLEQVISDINQTAYGLTFALHSRLMDRAEHCAARLNVGNIYINRNQVGAVVGTQPFGGLGLSGTGPKAGGPHYLQAFVCRKKRQSPSQQAITHKSAQSQQPGTDLKQLNEAIASLHPSDWPRRNDRRQMLELLCAESAVLSLELSPAQQQMPGATGESNTLKLQGRDSVLCLGPQPQQAIDQALLALLFGGTAVICVNDFNRRDPMLAKAIERLRKSSVPIALLEGTPSSQTLTLGGGFSLVAWYGDNDQARAIKCALAARTGAIVSLACGYPESWRYFTEKHICVDTTAIGGNLTLMANSSA